MHFRQKLILQRKLSSVHRDKEVRTYYVKKNRIKASKKKSEFRAISTFPPFLLPDGGSGLLIFCPWKTKGLLAVGGFDIKERIGDDALTSSVAQKMTPFLAIFQPSLPTVEGFMVWLDYYRQAKNACRCCFYSIS